MSTALPLAFIGSLLFVILIIIVCLIALFVIAKKLSNKFFEIPQRRIGTIGLVGMYLTLQIALFFYFFPLFLILNFLFLNIIGHIIVMGWIISHFIRLPTNWQKIITALLVVLLLFLEYQLIIWQWDRSMK